jgi:outer membrane biosynthesis protein TonB
MGSDESQTKPKSQANYEAAVLEFLDKEMAAAQPTQKQGDQSNELDALVSDLLKQVITESDQPNDGKKAESDEMGAMLSEFPPTPEEASRPGGRNLEQPASTPRAPANAPQVTKPAKETSSPKPSTVPAPAFASPVAAKGKMAGMALAFACLLALVGFAIHHFTGSTKNAPKIAGSQPLASIPGGQSHANPASAQPDSKAAAHPATAPMLDKKPSATHSVSPVSAVAAQKTAPSKAATTPPAVQQAINPPKEQPEPAPLALANKSASPVPNKEEKPATEKPPAAQATAPAPPAAAPTPPAAQTTAPAPPAAASSVPVEKPAPPPVSDTAAQEKKPAQPAPVVTSTVENSEPSPQTPDSAPAASRVLIPPVPILQVSPSFPDLALRTHTSAKVVLDLLIDEQGKVVKATPVSGPAMFHSAAVNAALKWRYKPASIGGTNVSSQSRVTMNFNLQK